jgi:hypothetical protein
MIPVIITALICLTVYGIVDSALDYARTDSTASPTTWTRRPATK